MRFGKFTDAREHCWEVGESVRQTCRHTGGHTSSQMELLNHINIRNQVSDMKKIDEPTRVTRRGGSLSCTSELEFVWVIMGCKKSKILSKVLCQKRG